MLKTISLVLFILFHISSIKDLPLSYFKDSNDQTSIQVSAKFQAYQVLQIKCNACHATKRKTDIFTLDNMDSLAPEIRNQVFVKKKMPKGRKVKLTIEELSNLDNWLKIVLEEK